MTDESLLTAAKLREAIDGDLDTDLPIHPHAGVVSDPEQRQTLSFVESVCRDAGAPFASLDLGKEVLASIATEESTEAVLDGDSHRLARLLGVTEADLVGSSLRLSVQILDELENGGAPAFVSAVGNPNSGKTNTVSLLTELRSADLDGEPLVLSNVRSWTLTDRAVTSAHDLAVALLEEPDRPKIVVIDEGSTHFDARTYRREVAQQWTPLAKRMAKVGVDCCTIVGHTGKDLHPEIKRMTSLAVHKPDQETAEFFGEWKAEDGHPSDRLFGGEVESIEPTGAAYDPDDAAPWAWNLEPELFARDASWAELHELLVERGPSP